MAVSREIFSHFGQISYGKNKYPAKVDISLDT
jgi:hypothetical protein